MKYVDLDHIQQDTDVSKNFQSYLNDESGIVNDGQAERILFPRKISELQEVISYAYSHDISYTISGGGTGISGGRVPHKGWIIATDQMVLLDDDRCETWEDPESGLIYSYFLEKIDSDQALITLPVAITVKALQNLCRDLGWFYPPDPTERSAFLGGNVATNASGARTFKWGTTRNWTERLKIILPDGELIKLDRAGDKHQLTETDIILSTSSGSLSIPRPTYKLPSTDKNVAGPVITDTSKPIDLFIGTGGMFGVVSELTLRLIRPPHSLVSLFIFTKSPHDALDLIKFTQQQKSENKSPIPMSVEYLGPQVVDILKQYESQIPDTATSLVMLEQDAGSDDEMMDYLQYWWKVCERFDVVETLVAQSHQEIEHHKMLRHKVPETVNATVRSYGQAKLGTDYAVPDGSFPELFHYVIKIGKEFEKYQNTKQTLGDKIGYALWAHAGNSHVHLNLLPRDDEEDKYAKVLITKVLNKVVELDGSIAAEHGLGKKRFDGKPALQFQYGKEGLDQIRKMKQAIDPKFLLNPGNILP